MQLKNSVLIMSFSLILFSATSCKSQDLSDKNKIYSLVIDKNVHPMPPPPPPKEGDTITRISEHILDSINQITLDVAVVPDFEPIEGKPHLSKECPEYNPLIKKLYAPENKNGRITFDRTNKGHRLHFVDSLPNSNAPWRPGGKYNAWVHLSNIVFDKSNKKAALLFFESYGGKLSGALYLVLLKKTNGEWRILDETALSIS